MQSNEPLQPIDQATRFGRLITSVYREWRRQVDQIFKDMEMSEATRMPIIVLYDHGATMRQKDLAEALAQDGSSLFRTLNLLRDKGLISWVTDPDDRRAKQISLTGTGHEMALKILERSRWIEARVMSDYDSADLATTRALLEKTLHRLEQLRD